MLSFVSGGARSGKSTWAETTAYRCWQQKSGALYYLATAHPAASGEMHTRIQWHQNSRAIHWETLEESVYLDRALPHIAHNSTVVIDCMTLWASQVMFDSDLTTTAALTLLDDFIQTALRQNIDLFVVSNDINEAIPIQDAGVQAYLIFLQHIHHYLAGRADNVVQMLAGLPYYWRQHPHLESWTTCN